MARSGAEEILVAESAAKGERRRRPLVAGDKVSDRVAAQHHAATQLLTNLKAALPDLEKLLTSVSDHWGYEDTIYRFYHQSFKVFHQAQGATTRIIKALSDLMPDRPLNKWFMEIVAAGTGREFTYDDNHRWLEATRPMVEAFFHARFMLEMAVKYAKELDEAPTTLPSGWAALLYLYDLR